MASINDAESLRSGFSIVVSYWTNDLEWFHAAADHLQGAKQTNKALNARSIFLGCSQMYHDDLIDVVRIGLEILSMWLGVYRC